jgi:hypothetical protein
MYVETQLRMMGPQDVRVIDRQRNRGKGHRN